MQSPCIPHKGLVFLSHPLSSTYPLSCSQAFIRGSGLLSSLIRRMNPLPLSSRLLSPASFLKRFHYLIDDFLFCVFFLSCLSSPHFLSVIIPSFCFTPNPVPFLLSPCLLSPYCMSGTNSHIITSTHSSNNYTSTYLSPSFISIISLRVRMYVHPVQVPILISFHACCIEDGVFFSLPMV